MKELISLLSLSYLKNYSVIIIIVSIGFIVNFFLYFTLFSSILLRKIYQNTGFLCPVFSRIRKKSKILSFYVKRQLREKTYSGTFSAVFSFQLHIDVVMFKLFFQ